MSNALTTPRRVAMLAYDAAQILDIVGPYQMFAAARLADGRPAYTLELWAPAAEIHSTSGLTLTAARPIDTVTEEDLGHLHTFLIAGGEGSRTVMHDESLVAFVRRAAEAAERTATVCTGAFILAATGLADGRRLATHWRWAEGLQRRFPAVEVDGEALFVKDGTLWSSAGVTAGIDLSLAMIERDLGREAALELARQHVLYLIRHGSQSQFSAELAAQAPRSGRLRSLCSAILDQPCEPWTLPQLADRAAMSERSLARHFLTETGLTPAAFVERARLDRSRRLIEAGAGSLDAIAADAGFGSLDRMRRAYLRRLGITPSAYRAHFDPTPREMAPYALATEEN